MLNNTELTKHLLLGHNCNNCIYKSEIDVTNIWDDNKTTYPTCFYGIENEFNVCKNWKSREKQYIVGVLNE